MFLHMSVILSTGRESLYDVTSFLATWSHVPCGGLCLWSHVPSRGVSVSSHVPTWGTTPCRAPPPYGKERTVYILLECILVYDLFVDLHDQFPSFVALELDKEEIINVTDF